MGRRALITGITGQDGSYLAEHLVAEGYEVFGFVRDQSNARLAGLQQILPEVRIVRGDLQDQGSLIATLEQTQPDEVYNLAAISYVPTSWQQAEVTADVTGVGVLRLVDAIRILSGIGGSRSTPKGQIRFYQASSSEMFGKVGETPQNEDTPFHPCSPYGVAKAYGHYITQSYRESFGMHCVSGILFNHTSPRQRREFITRKVTSGAARIKLGLASELRLGNLNARRDWGFAGDYVRAMHLMLQRDAPRDYVVGTGSTHSVREVLELAFGVLKLQWEEHVVIDPTLVRPVEVNMLCADATRAREELGWEPTLTLEELINTMVETDLASLVDHRHDTLRGMHVGRKGYSGP